MTKNSSSRRADLCLLDVFSTTALHVALHIDTLNFDITLLRDPTAKQLCKYLLDISSKTTSQRSTQPII